MDTATRDLISLTNGIVHTFHDPLRRDIPYIRKEIDLLYDMYIKKISSLEKMKELFHQFEVQVLKHMKKEEEVFFPVLCEVEDCYS